MDWMQMARVILGSEAKWVDVAAVADALHKAYADDIQDGLAGTLLPSGAIN